MPNATKQSERQRRLLRRLRAKLRGDGTSLRQAARELDCSAATLSRLLAGQITLTGKREERIVELLGSSAELDREVISGLEDITVDQIEQVLHIMERLLLVRKSLVRD